MMSRPATEDRPPAVSYRRRGAPLSFLLLVVLLIGPPGEVRAGDGTARAVAAPGTSGLSFIEAGGAWTPHGPGPVTALAPHPTDANVLYVGTANAGIWRTGNARAPSPTWTRLTTAAEGLAIRALAFDPDDGETLIAGVAGYGGLRGEGAGGPTVLYAQDAGEAQPTWQRLDLPEALDVSAVAARGDVLLAAADGPGEGAGGLWRSADRGQTWNRIDAPPGQDGDTPNGLPSGPVTDLVGDPHPDRRDLFYVTVIGRGVYLSDDAGARWFDYGRSSEPLREALGAPDANNARMAVAGTGRLYLGVLRGGLLAFAGYADIDAGWALMELPGTDQPDLGLLVDPRAGRAGRRYLSIAADPRDPDVVAGARPDLVYAGGDRQPAGSPAGVLEGSGRLFRGSAGQPALRFWWPLASSQWTALTAPGSAPAGGSRAMAFDAAGDLVEGDDGGVYRRENPTTEGAWVDLTGDLRTAEVHDVAYDANADTILAAVHDVGLLAAPTDGSQPWVRDPLGADGDDVQVDDAGSASLRFRSGQLLAMDPAAGMQGQARTPIALSGVAPMRLVVGAGNGVFESLDAGATFAPVSAPDLVANGGEGQVIAYGAADDPSALYVGSDRDVYVRTAAGGGGNLARSAAYPGSGPVRSVIVDPAEALTAYVCEDGAVHRTKDGGDTWEAFSGNLLQLATRCNVLAFVPVGDGNDAVLAGTDAGVFFALTTATPPVWAPLGADAPAAPVWDMEYDAADDVLVVGTLGAGAWSYTPVTGETPTPPAPTVQCPPNQVAEATGPDGAALTWPPATVAGGTPPVTLVCRSDQGLESGDTTPLGTTTVTCTATDADNRTDTCTFTVTVQDTTPPTITGCPQDMTIVSGADTVVSFTPPTATDLVDPDPEIECQPASGSLFPADTTTVVTCTATDDAGNEAVCTFEVTVTDVPPPPPPTVQCPPDQVREATGPAGAVVTWPAATVTGGTPPVTVACRSDQGLESGDTFPLGTTTVTCTATDADDRAGTCTFEVTVEDTTPPDVACPADMVVDADGPDGAIVEFGSVMADDLVDGALSATCSPASGAEFPEGTTTVVRCAATDAAGNQGACEFTVTVRPWQDDLCDPPFVCEGALHDATIETEVFVGDTPEIALSVVFLDGYRYDADVLDRVDIDYDDAFPGEQTGLQDVLTVEDLVVRDGVAHLVLSVAADTSIFPAGSFGEEMKRIDVVVNGRRNVGIARFVAEEIRPGARFSWNPRLGDRGTCPASLALPADWPPVPAALERFAPRFRTLDNRSVEQWEECP